MTTSGAVLGLAVWLLAAAGAAGAASPRPHIVFILADDLGWNDVSFHGSNQIMTPNIDALAYSGVILHNYYVMPICTPSRAALLTGRHPAHTGMQRVLYAQQPYGLPLRERLLPQYLKELGYATHAVGKWHLGHFQAAYTPTRRGFDSHFGYWAGHQDYYDHTSQEGPGYWGYDMRRGVGNVSWSSYGRYSTDLFSEEAVRLIHQHDAETPLFLYLAHLATHAGNPYQPLQAPADVVGGFAHINDTRRRTFAGMVAKLDESVGLVVTALRAKGMLENSIIVFSTDNGGPTNGYDNNVASNWPLKGIKDTPWEGGVRGVGLVWSPLIPDTPRVADHLMHIQDWLPTLLSAANYTAELPEDLDGRDMWPVLAGNGSAPYSDLLLDLDRGRGLAALRSGDWKLVQRTTNNGNNDGWYGPTGRDPDLEYDSARVLSSAVAAALENTSAPLAANQSLLLELRAAVTVVCNSSETTEALEHSPNSLYYDRALFQGSHCEPAAPCLFNVAADPCELQNLAAARPAEVARLQALLANYNQSYAEALSPGLDPASNPKYWNYTWTNWRDYPAPTLLD
ncbi:arylsulfatase B-like [Bacillus rossius redtenbacheri]|uniref:arylsulfatase B-like n=1 Tax=Bacillus rossius redtenbacheri TaxID=93214 RepID=UPI002FDD0030